MIKKTKPTGARVFLKLLVGLLPMLALVLVASGCGNAGPGQPMPPDMTGIWKGSLDWPDVGQIDMMLDLKQQPEGGLSGTIRFLEEGAPPEDINSVPVSRGSVDGQGGFQVMSDTEGETLNVSGEAAGDEMDASFEVGGPSLDYRATRISEQDYDAYLAQRGKDYKAEHDRGEAERTDMLAAGDNYDALAANAEGLGNNVTARLDSLSDDLLGTPEEQLQDALGPEDTGSDLYACSTGGVSCEVASLEQHLENDQDDISGESGTSASPCDIVDFEYYENYEGFDSEGGAEYLETRDNLAGEIKGLGDKAREAREAAQEAAAARDDAEAAGDSPSELEYSVADTDQMVADADAAEKEVGQAIEAADARYADYEARASEVIATGLTLRGEAGC